MGYNVLPEESEPVVTSHINGSLEETIARYQISELCKDGLFTVMPRNGRTTAVCLPGREPMYERSSMARRATRFWTHNVFLGLRVAPTAWSGGLTIEKFIEVSIKGRANGDFIMHRENGTLANVNLAKQRGIGKMKATITQRFTIEGVPVDVECDCRFIFFVKIEDGEWKTQFVRLFYEKDKVTPVDGKTMPEGVFVKEELDKYTEGYKFLAIAQNSLGHPILDGLPNASNQGWYDMYKAMADWLQGQDVNLFWEKSLGMLDILRKRVRA
ncbi:hypothetical protein PV04_07787 [Phialophora macrospora]|uniref:SnoaL-like domain-containing protein n=1 Tax=Phialophora macrospora TaxID=1851006 RepID=A0A0D2FC39_9EURO|nr:hypothetical protein PV04_07787 [Phialophora macrospora]